MTAETGVMIQSFGRSTSRTMDYVYDASLGYDTGFVAHNPEASYSIKGRLKFSGTPGAASLPAAAPGIALTVAGSSFGNGVGTMSSDAGGIFSQTVGIDHGEKGFKEINVSAMQKPGIAAS